MRRSHEGCPPSIKLLALTNAGEDVPHLRECSECAQFVSVARETLTVFHSRTEIEQALAGRLDEVLANAYGHRMTSAVMNARELHRSIVVDELLRRAEATAGASPSKMLDFTSAALSVCDAMAARGDAPDPELRIEALKQHATALRQLGSLDAAIAILGRALALVDQTAEPERHRAVLTLCAAIVDAEPDRAKFDEAISLAESAGAVLEVFGDERRAVLARQTKAYVLTVTRRFAEALPLLRDVVAELECAVSDPEPWASRCDLAIALASLAECLLGVGSYEEAAQVALRSEGMHREEGRITSAARAAHMHARALSALGSFDEARPEFLRTAEVMFDAKLFDEWAVWRLDYVAAALAHDPAADVRTELESVARACMTLNANESSFRRQCAAEALAHLRQLAQRNVLMFEAVDQVREYVARNATRPPVKFVPPRGGTFPM